MKKKQPLLAITMGDPAGIGPEVIVKALSKPDSTRRFQPWLIGNLAVFEDAVRCCRMDLPLRSASTAAEAERPGAGVPVFELGFDFRTRPKTWSKQTGAASHQAVVKAVELAQKKQVAALVTGPICKQAWHAAGIRVPGHTELLAQLTRSKQFAMMFVGGPFRLLLATIHVALREVPDRITPEKLRSLIRLGAGELQKRFGIPHPKIAVAGLNPHAGENGQFGKEEVRIIRPALRAFARNSGFTVSGPHPPDTLFAEAVRGNFDLVVCMYHDQGLIPFKMLALHQGVNVTLGLPILRTSPDHGTAFDLAGTGRADPGSMLAALRTAVELAKRAGR